MKLGKYALKIAGGTLLVGAAAFVAVHDYQRASEIDANNRRIESICNDISYDSGPASFTSRVREQDDTEISNLRQKNAQLRREMYFPIAVEF